MFAYVRRVGFFALANLSVIVLMGIVLRVSGVDQWLVDSGFAMGPLLVFASLFGFGGAIVSLFLSKPLAKRGTKARVIEAPQSSVERWLVDTVARQAEAAGIGMPEVAIFPSPQPNAFATGARRNAALVAVSEGLLHSMDRDEVEAVLAHEVSHVANGDMVTMALLQGVLNTFVIVIARIVGGIVDNVVFRNERGIGIGYWVTVIAAEILLGIGASIVAMSYSRRREFRADAGSAQLVGREKMIRALRRLDQASGPSQLPESMAAFGIRGGEGTGLQRLFRSHPSIPDRIAALQQG